MARKTNALTEAEWQVMRVVWEHQPCAAPAVQEELQAVRDWSYSTVKTMMDRMVEKGLLKTEKIRNLFLYRSTITRSQAQKGEIMRTVKRAFDGALTPMMQFMLDSSDFTTDQLGELEELIRKKRIDAGAPGQR